MTHVYERVTLQCPYAQAREYLREVLEPASREGTAQSLPLAQVAVLTITPAWPHMRYRNTPTAVTVWNRVPFLSFRSVS